MITRIIFIDTTINPISFSRDGNFKLWDIESCNHHNELSLLKTGSMHFCNADASQFGML